MLSNISDLFTMASLAICMLLSGIIFYYLRTRINMLEQSVMEQAHLLQQVLRQSQNQPQQQQQMVVAAANANTGDGGGANATSTSTGGENQQQLKQKLIQVSDDSDDDSDDSDDDDDDDDDSGSDDDDEDDVNAHHSTKLIDLSALASTAPSDFFDNSGGGNAEIKVIELKHSFNGGNDNSVVYNCDDSDSDSDDSDDSDSDDGDSDDSDSDGHDDSTAATSSKNKNNYEKELNYNPDKKKKYEKNNKGVKKHENGNTLHESLDGALPVPLKNMPVNMLRDLAKTKLAHLEQPAINKMSKKEILKALDN